MRARLKAEAFLDSSVELEKKHKIYSRESVKFSPESSDLSKKKKKPKVDIEEQRKKIF